MRTIPGIHSWRFNVGWVRGYGVAAKGMMKLWLRNRATKYTLFSKHYYMAVHSLEDRRTSRTYFTQIIYSLKNTTRISRPAFNLF